MSYDWDRLHQIPCDGPCPQGSVIPDDQITREVHKHGSDKKSHAHQPIEMTRGCIRACDENPYHVQQNEDDHDLAGPVMDVSDEKPIRYNVCDILDRCVRL